MPEMEICAFDFEPCGYSLKAIHGSSFSTIQVTPEDGSIYAGYEVIGLDPASMTYGDVVKRVLRSFSLYEFFVVVTIFGGGSLAGTLGERLDVGDDTKNMVIQELPFGGLLIYESFSIVGEVFIGSPRSVMNCFVDCNLESGSKIDAFLCWEDDVAQDK